MKLTLTTLCLFLSFCSFGQREFPDDFRKGGIEVNSQLTDLSLYSLDSVQFNSSDLKNKVTVINYWFVGCGGCRQEEEFMKEITEYFREEEKVQFISITPSTSEEVKEYFQKHGDFGFPVYPAGGFKQVKKTFSVKTFPHTQIVVDGTIVENLQIPIARAEWKDWLIDEIKEELVKLE
ncbi:TlpA family protein disulfide reductase [Fulvivirga ligni]|uniref:TlpA family protein disulfide reductase n=1 Tax=Fulvivirga ligni TaxID=2904246 RepID=UPI001F4202A7|nr:TlpA disulfide reductase family protein [Fulvivirga ligni]UII19111.1 TlpA family protein disulfide reductase [Fulvivirga ligni]